MVRPKAGPFASLRAPPPTIPIPLVIPPGVIPPPDIMGPTIEAI